jgi:hypothetical protein
MRSEILTVVSINIMTFWNVTTWIIVEMYQRYGTNCYLHLIHLAQNS